MFSYNFMLLFLPAIIECFPAILQPQTIKSDVKDETAYPNGTAVVKYSYTDNEGKPETIKPDVRDETTYPNGTVVGKYSYIDNDGTPVQVKYYADEKNYGVELQSVKVVEATEQPAPFNKQLKTDYLRGEASDSSPVPTEPETTGNLGFDFPTTFPKPEDKYKVPADFLSMNKNIAKNHCKEGKTLEYDFSPNGLMPLRTKKCGKDRVRLYYDKRSRRVRKTVGSYDNEMPKVCDQF